MKIWNGFEGESRPESVCIQGREIRRGARVRLWPRSRADILDQALEGKTAIIDSIEQDYEDRIHFAVLVDDDPGKDLGAAHQIGHRFFFRHDEVELLDSPG